MKTQATAARRVHVSGVVQGVGFRPFVYGLAQRLALCGWVRNTSAGVEIVVEGAAEALDTFVQALSAEAPPLARIEHIHAEAAAPNGYTDFQIRHSEAIAGAYQLISPDVATCDACLAEIFDPHDRRYRYAFTNCTNCGPRFTIIRDIPYDRPLTTMADFPMCADCQREYDDPLDRRFHAQPNACPVCGPQLEFRPSPQPPAPPSGAHVAHRSPRRYARGSRRSRARPNPHLPLPERALRAPSGKGRWGLGRARDRREPRA